MRPYSKGGRREIVVQPRVYGFDTGLVCHVRGWDTLRPDDCGGLWEHVVLEGFVARGASRIHYWRDKQQREVSDRPAPGHTPRPGQQAPVPAAPVTGQPSAQADPIDAEQAPLDPETIQRLTGTLRGLPRPVLQGFTKAFRKRFQIPEDAPTIAGAITQRCHHEWIEAWLVSHQALLA